MKRFLDKFYPCPQEASAQEVSPAPPQTGGEVSHTQAPVSGPALHVYSEPSTWLLDTVSHRWLVSAATRWHLPPPHMMPEGFTGRKRDARNNREKGNQSQGHSKTIIPPGRLLVRPPPHCWYRKGSYQGSSEERLCSARGKFT